MSRDISRYVPRGGIILSGDTLLNWLVAVNAVQRYCAAVRVNYRYREPVTDNTLSDKLRDRNSCHVQAKKDL
jgi:hypothetical protein